MNTAELDHPHEQHQASTLADLRSRRASPLAVGLLAASLSAASGCSLIFADGPPKAHRQMGYFDCTSSNLAPVTDAVLGGIEGIGTIGMLASQNDSYSSNRSDLLITAAVAATFGISAVIGFQRTSACREAKAELMMRAEQALPTLSAPAPVVDPWLAPPPPANGGGWAPPPAPPATPAPAPTAPPPANAPGPPAPGSPTSPPTAPAP